MSASVEFHSELAKDHKTTKGGGWWTQEGDTLYLYGRSTDFGRANINDVKDAFRKFLPLSIRAWDIYYSDKDNLTDAMFNGTKIRDKEI